MAKFNEKTFNPEAFGRYVDRIPKTKRNEMIKYIKQITFQISHHNYLSNS